MADDTEVITCAVDVATGRFLTSGAVVDGVTVTRVELPRNPDERLERYSFDDQAIVAKSAEEIETETLNAKTAAARKILAGVPFLADVVAEFAGIVAPLVNKTPAEVVAQMTTGVITRMVTRGA